MRTKVMSFLIFLLLGAAEAFAGNQVIVKLEPNMNIRNVARFLGGRVLDQIPNQNLFLVEVPARMPDNARFLGVHSWEPNRIVRKLNTVSGFIMNGPSLAPHWYDAQPALTRIGRPAAELVSTGRGVVIADVNSGVDVAHPALIGGLTSGYDFVLGRPYTISAAVLDQSDVAFLDQSDVAFLDQSDGAFFDAGLSFAGVDAASRSYLTA